MKRPIAEMKQMPQYQAPELNDIQPVSMVACNGTSGEGAGDEDEKDDYED